MIFQKYLSLIASKEASNPPRAPTIDVTDGKCKNVTSGINIIIKDQL